MILFFPFDLLSHNLRCLQLAEAVKEDIGVRIASSEKYNLFFKNAGIETFDCPGISPEPVMEASKRFDFSWIKKELLEKAFLAQVESIRTYRPDAVVGDASFTLRMAAAYTGTPYISIINGYMSRYYSRTRSLPLSHPAAKFRNKIPEQIFSLIIRFAETLAHWTVHRPFRKLARQYKFSSKKMFLQEVEGDLTLLADAPELFPQKNLPDNIAFIGPLYHSSKESEPEIIDFISNEKKNILISMGSSGDPNMLHFLKEDLFAGFNIISTTPLCRDDKKHIYYKAFINIASIINHMDIVICHGGNGTIYQALQAGVPVLCAPSIFEQEWNLQGVEALLLGERLKPTEKEAYEQIMSWISKRKEIPHLPVEVEGSKRKFREAVRSLIKNHELRIKN